MQAEGKPVLDYHRENSSGTCTGTEKTDNTRTPEFPLGQLWNAVLLWWPSSLLVWHLYSFRNLRYRMVMQRKFFHPSSFDVFFELLNESSIWSCWVYSETVWYFKKSQGHCPSSASCALTWQPWVWAQVPEPLLLRDTREILPHRTVVGVRDDICTEWSS